MMPRPQRWIPGLAALVVAVACGDHASTEPTIFDASPAARSSAGSDVVRLLKRDDALPPLIDSEIIGPRGGRLEIKRAGVMIDFARGAVSAPTRITVTALRGNNVAYTFEPHGIVFKAPVTVRQSLRHTAAWKNAELAADLQGSYFERLLVDPSEVFARSLERRPGKLKGSGLMRYLEFSIEHFSGYTVSTGKSGIDIEVDIDITSR
jgi:hypothetical protein